MVGSPLMWLAAAFAAGIAAGRSAPEFAAAAITGTVALAVAAVAVRRRWPAVSAAFLAAGAILAGSAAFQLQFAGIARDRITVLYDSGAVVSGDPVELQGKVIGGPEPAPDSVVIEVAAKSLIHKGDNIPASGNVRLYLPAKEGSERQAAVAGIKYGTEIRVATRLERSDKYVVPGVQQRSELLDQQGIDAIGMVKSSMLIEILSPEARFSPLNAIFDQRRKLIEEFYRNFDQRTAGVLIASLLGDKYYLDRDTAEVFREGGTFHILVISGLHITFIGWLLLIISGVFVRHRAARYLITCAVLWAYTIAVGAEVPVVRAAVMFTILMLSQMLYRPANLMNMLGLSALLLLAVRPSDLFTASFQLTFISVSAIIVTAMPLIEKFREIGSWIPNSRRPFPPNVAPQLLRFCEMLYWRPTLYSIDQKRNVWKGRIFKMPYLPRIAETIWQRAAAYLFEGLLLSLCVQMYLLPLQIIYFNRVSPAAIILNLWAGAIIAAESLISLIALAIAQLSGPLAMPFIKLTEMCNYLLIIVPQAISYLPLANFRLPAYSGAGRSFYFVYLILVAAAAYALFRWDMFILVRRKNMRRAAVALAAAITICSAVLLLHPLSEPKPDGRLHITFLDVDQGDAIFVQFPKGATMLIDAGGKINFGSDEDGFRPDVPGVGEFVVSKYLWHLGYSEIGAVIATHADADHIEGMSDVARNFSIGRAFYGRPAEGEPDFDRWIEILRRQGVPVQGLAAGDEVKIDGVSVEALWPRADSDGSGSSNNDSLVLRLTYGKRAVLLTGDIELAAENGLIASGADISADVIKVPHHGSRTSSSPGLIEAVKPQIAIISAGRGSMFGHPHREILDRWNGAGVEVMVTARSDTITLSTDGEDEFR